MTTTVCEMCGFAGEAASIIVATSTRTLWRRLACARCFNELHDGLVKEADAIAARLERGAEYERRPPFGPASRQVGPFTLAYDELERP